MDWFFITRIGSISFHVMDLNFSLMAFLWIGLFLVFQSIGLIRWRISVFLRAWIKNGTIQISILLRVTDGFSIGSWKLVFFIGQGSNGRAPGSFMGLRFQRTLVSFSKDWFYRVLRMRREKRWEKWKYFFGVGSQRVKPPEFSSSVVPALFVLNTSKK